MRAASECRRALARFYQVALVKAAPGIEECAKRCDDAQADGIEQRVTKAEHVVRWEETSQVDQGAAGASVKPLQRKAVIAKQLSISK